MPFGRRGANVSSRIAENLCELLSWGRNVGIHKNACHEDERSAVAALQRGLSTHVFCCSTEVGLDAVDWTPLNRPVANAR
jgi:hypothetical protein